MVLFPVQPGYVRCAEPECYWAGGFQMCKCSLHWLPLGTVLQGVLLPCRNRGKDMKNQICLFILIHLAVIYTCCLISSLPVPSDDYVSKY